MQGTDRMESMKENPARTGSRLVGADGKPIQMQWKIGNVQIDNPFVLAPMAGVTDLPFRTLCKEQGAGLICMEMISAKAISFHNKNTYALMEIDPCEHPVSMQLFGSEPDLMAEVAKSIEDREFDILDINMGCPVPKVVNNGEGSALLKTPDLIEEIVRKVSSAIKKPVTVKVRIGFENEPIDIVEIAKRIEDAGAAARAVHGRTRQQYYSGTADWDTIRSFDPSVLQGSRIFHLTSHKLSCSVFCSLQQMRHITFHYKPPFLALYTAGSQAAGDITL